MKDHLFTGKKGEQLAEEFLSRQGYRILHRNFRYEKAEVDLIVSLRDLIVFAEVKCRQSNHWGYPEFAVTKAKQKRLYLAAEAYLIRENLEDRPVRFDILAMTLSDSQNPVVHFPDAFRPIAEETRSPDLSGF